MIVLNVTYLRWIKFLSPNLLRTFLYTLKLFQSRSFLSRAAVTQRCLSHMKRTLLSLRINKTSSKSNLTYFRYYIVWIAMGKTICSWMVTYQTWDFHFGNHWFVIKDTLFYRLPLFLKEVFVAFLKAAKRFFCLYKTNNENQVLSKR